MKQVLCGAFMICFLAFKPAIADIVLFEDFEVVGSSRVGVTYTGPADALVDINNNDYYGVINLAAGANITYGNVQGTEFYGAQDTDGSLGGDGPLDPLVLDWTGVDIDGATNLNLSWFVAEDTAADGNEDWDIGSSVRISAQIDGGGFNDIFAIESVDGAVGNRAPAVDTDFDGVGDGAAITDVFTQFTATIGTGSTLDLRLTIQDLDTGDEDIGFDSFLLTGDFATVPEPGSLGVLCLNACFLSLWRRKRNAVRKR